jgi:hypothetical protein
MNERKTLPDKAAHRCRDHSGERIAHQLGGSSADGSLVDSGNSGSPDYLGHFRLSPMAKQTLVDNGLLPQTTETTKVVKTVSNKTRHGKSRKAGRPASSSDVRLTPQFRTPVDIERLGKALVAIAMKQTVKLDSDSNEPTTEANDDVEE